MNVKHDDSIDSVFEKKLIALKNNKFDNENIIQNLNSEKMFAKTSCLLF